MLFEMLSFGVFYFQKNVSFFFLVGVTTPLHIQNAPKGASFELQRGQPLRALNAQWCK
jgi:hypothetical protein